jgi:N-hydroxyarylamine O-acetyltransferase
VRKKRPYPVGKFKMADYQLQELRAYLGRLGYQAPPPATLQTLSELQLRHTRAFAFETLSPMLRSPVPIDLPALEQKILCDGRGGYCYELNLLFIQLLQQLGFQVRGITGRVVMGCPENAWTARTHCLGLVLLDGVSYITDVGFGRMVPTAPLRLDTEDAQLTSHEPFRITQQDGSFTLRAQVGNIWRAMYVFDLQPQAHVDYEMGNWYVSTHPQSPLIGQLMAARAEPGLRRTLINGSYAIHPTGGVSERRQLTDADEVIDVLKHHFAIQPPLHPDLRQTIARLVERPRSA